MKTKIFLPVFAVIAALAIVFGASAFNDAPKAKETKPSVYFYRYKLTTYAPASIRNIANYERTSLSCSPGSHICGVKLATDTGSGNAPDPDEFDEVKEQLVTSEANGTPANSDISMRN